MFTEEIGTDVDEETLNMKTTSAVNQGFHYQGNAKHNKNCFPFSKRGGVDFMSLLQPRLVR